MQNIIQNIINVITNFYSENQLLVIFIVLNIFNVIIQTVKSIATIKCKKLPAALINAVAYGLYTVVTVYMMCELPLGWKAGIVAACNLIGVYIVKDIEERKRKDKRWKIEVNLVCDNPDEIKNALISHGIAGAMYAILYTDNEGTHIKFEMISKTQEESRIIKSVFAPYDGNYFAIEGQNI